MVPYRIIACICKWRRQNIVTSLIVWIINCQYYPWRLSESLLQVGRRVQLNKTWSFNHQKSNFNEAFTKSAEFESEKDVSCLSSGCSGDSSARTKKLRNGKIKQVVAVGEQPTEKPVGSAHIRRRGEAILKFLSQGSASEVKIRQVLGDSPDTSKALRMWVS